MFEFMLTFEHIIHFMCCVPTVVFLFIELLKPFLKICFVSVDDGDDEVRHLCLQGGQ